MHVIWALCQKEWRINLDTPQGYVVSIAFLLASGFFFGSNLFLNGQADMRHWFAMLPLLYIFFIPAMAMRLFADERKDGTYELLATMPTRTIELVLGKYCSLMGHLSALLLLTVLYPLSLALLGDVDAGLIAAAYLAAWLLAASFSAICLYASALTSHAMVAYIVGLILLLSLFLLTQVAPTLSPALQDVVVMLGPINHFQNMLRGVVSLADVVLFMALTIIFLALSWFELERRRWR
ncbi:MAG: ABC transporter permease [Mariprofundaceae bacterium]|nr:ABC transporter permease [Mariprofundaceae bacterium]